MQVERNEDKKMKTALLHDGFHACFHHALTAQMNMICIRDMFMLEIARHSILQQDNSKLKI
jgi:hypothetical protein